MLKKFCPLLVGTQIKCNFKYFSQINFVIYTGVTDAFKQLEELSKTLSTTTPKYNKYRKRNQRKKKRNRERITI